MLFHDRPGFDLCKRLRSIEPIDNTPKDDYIIKDVEAYFDQSKVEQVINNY